MHPDQATGAIVQHAVNLNIPFAVVPCCVFGNLFSGRRRSEDGNVVSSYEDLLQWLCERAPPGSIQSTFLPFVGKSKVLYTAAAACPRSRLDEGGVVAEDAAAICLPCEVDRS
mmetsp:Transcript_4314/g.10456  ORF Transcript_4314/g.10456 Transcript_4314/m.10456 type:complete len:113 (-) Transcript_4314:244-582(-)